jgi:drug/metabolite transporter (DMT)-like permease
MSTAALVVLIPASLAELAGILTLPGAEPITLTLEAAPIVATGVVYSAIVVTVIGIVVLFAAYRHLSVARVAATFYVSPLTGVLLGAMWLREPVGPPFIAGAALILLGVFLSTRPAEHPADSA